MSRLLSALLRWLRSFGREPLVTAEQMRRLFAQQSRLKVRFKEPDARWRAR